MWRFGFPNPVNYNDNELFCGGYAGEECDRDRATATRTCLSSDRTGRQCDDAPRLVVLPPTGMTRQTSRPPRGRRAVGRQTGVAGEKSGQGLLSGEIALDSSESERPRQI